MPRARGGAPPLTEQLGGGLGEGEAGWGETPEGECTTCVDFDDRTAARGARERSEAPASGLPCQNSHNSIIDPPGRTPFPPSARRTAFALQLNVAAFCERHGLERVGFLTLTFREHVLDSREAQRRLNSLTTNVLRPRYREAIRVIERQKSGRIHYHLLVALPADIRTGFDFDAIARHDYRSACPALRAEWAFWRRTAPQYGFGRTELLPVKSTESAIGRYVGKYIAKHIGQRHRADKGIRLVSYVGTKVANTRFAWAGGSAAEWRAKLGGFVQMLFENGAITSPSMRGMKVAFGPRWAYHWRDAIMAFEVSTNV